MNILTSWRRALVTQLLASLPVHDDYPGDWDVRSGQRDGPWLEGKLAVVFAPAQRTDGEVNYARPQMIVRAWLPQAGPRETDPHDPEPIEQLMIDLATTLQPVLTTAVPDGYFLVDEILPDYDDWGVQATLTAWIRNPAHVETT